VTFWSPEQETLRDSARTFVRREVLPHLQRWEDERSIPRELHGAGGVTEPDGGSGCLNGSEVERHYRDARILGIGGGATEVLDDLAAKLLGFTR
jgi:alkylation response protein AidB-like acyl-CoA dehydrogenase